MNKKLVSVILIIIGGYFLIGNTIVSILLIYLGSIGYEISIYSDWLSTILIAILGIMLILIGFILKRKTKSDTS